MSASERICTKCSKPVTVGFVVDRGDMSVAQRPFWVEGEPQSVLGFTKTGGKNQFWVEAHRCTGCGFLELYANKIRN
jgi:hypothetical protein